MPSCRPIINGSRFSVGPEGVTVIQPYSVYDLDPTTTADNFLLFAQELGGIPRIGDPHPTIKGLYCEGKDFVPFANSKKRCKALITYRSMRITLDGVAMQEMSNFDADGKLMEVRYKPGYKVRGKVDGGTRQPVEAPVLRPGAILRFERLVSPNSEFGHPADNFKLCYGRTNATSFQGQPAYCWLCVDYQIREISGTGNGPWHEAIAFQFKCLTRASDENTVWQDHRHLALFKDKYSGMIPPDVDPLSLGYPDQEDHGNGFGRFITYPFVTFDTLKLPHVFGERNRDGRDAGMQQEAPE